MNIPQVFRPFSHLAAVAAFILTGCASVSVANVHQKGAPPQGLPVRIYVKEFTAPHETFHVGRTGGDLSVFVKKERRFLARDLAKRLSETVAPAVVLKEDKQPPAGKFWLVEGVYDRANDGNRALRMAVGFGAGGTKLETRVWISDLSVTPPRIFLRMLTTGGSGMAPGAVAAFTPALIFYWPGAVVNAGGAALSGLSVDRDRTAREISSVLAEYCHQNGLLKGSYRRPKRLGKVSFQSPVFQIPKVLPGD